MTPARLVRSADQAVLAAALEPGAVLCTLVGIEGGFSRRLGAQLVVGADSTLTGSLSDGCLEAELARQAEAARADRTCRTLRYGAGSPVIDFRLPCGAGVDVLVDPVPDRTVLRRLCGTLEQRSPGRLDIPGADLAIEYLPRLRVLALGAAPEVAALARIAEAFGADLVPLVPSGGLSGDLLAGLPPVDPWTAVALLFHEHEWERRFVPWALGTPAFLVGAIGGSQTRRQRLAMLDEAGVGAGEVARLRSPLGLIPQTRDPHTLALSVLAEIVRDYEALLDGAA
ncbi:XdhC family protein [Novosphingobium aerophilum]|uniref:XdhC family protein n=1 Tax=Novosphingobium aerophilum TaxID=2839843 RepID=A0A7X1F785_9SPHN|nr:XdhC family protein [Novosphingobium aerophilum]MBC2651656.1 XdhC family protein [Novosphingobium aerophilum]